MYLQLRMIQMLLRQHVTTYDCNLYFDLNFDGNLSEKERVRILILKFLDEDGNVLPQISDGNKKVITELQAGKIYISAKNFRKVTF
ncbi:MAG: hypothetical protein ACLUGJ_07800 [Blautia wexlerae]